jgi:hypothetical protein
MIISEWRWLVDIMPPPVAIVVVYTHFLRDKHDNNAIRL